MRPNFFSRIKGIFTPQVLGLVGGFVLGLITNLITDGSTPIGQALTAVTVIFFIVFAVFTIVQMRDETINNLNLMRLSAKVTFEKGRGTNEILYDELINYMREAKTSIQVVSLYKPPTLASSPARIKYFGDLEKLLIDKIAREQSFRFERILQVKQLVPEILQSSTVDRLTFEHCKQLVALENRNNHHTFRLWQVPDILSPMTFFIIDRKKLILLMPDVNSISIRGENSESFELGTKPLGTCLSLSDPEEKVVGEFIRLFERLAYHAYPIRRVVEDTQTNENPITLEV